MIIRNATANEILVITDMKDLDGSPEMVIQPLASVEVKNSEAGESKDLKAFITAGKITVTSYDETTVIGVQVQNEVTADIAVHAGLATGVHGAGASTVATTANISTHAGLSTGVHGVGGGTVAKVADIATDGNLSSSAQAVITAGPCDTDSNLSSSAQDAITKRHTAGTETFPYGGMYDDDTSVTTTLTLQSTVYPIASGFLTGLVNQVTFQNAKELKITVAGVYLVNWSLSVSVNEDTQAIEGVVLAGASGTTEQLQTSSVFQSINGVKASISGTGLVTCAVNDLIRIGLVNETGAGKIVTMNHGNLTIVKVG